ncbi:SDR family NAD(P)-dependent oxidoreductase, partial [Myxococcota bacterium]|nr:SDR family NAD(P)-dependent oxidoreductase [Myxococcota bacterium]
MGSEVRFDGRVVIVTGAGNGLGRSHALLFASRGAKVVVNDLGGGFRGEGKGSAAADKVVVEIQAMGGQAVANYDSVEDGAAIVKTAIDAFGRVDVVVNNAGILRDTSFHKMTQEDWDLIYRVHVLGAFRVTQAAWPHMRDQQYGRVVMTSSAAGIYGNFGQANYSMAKLGLLGFAKTLAHEGRTKGIHVNTIAPIAGSRMTETVLPKDLLDALKPEYVSALVAWLCAEECEETGGLFEVGGGYYSKLRWERTEGKTFRLGKSVTPEAIVGAWDEITNFEKSTHPADVTESMGPVVTNVSAGPARGGNEFIDVDQALGFELPEVRSRYDERDLSLYALSIGAGADPLNDRDLQMVYELHSEGFKPVGTYGVVPAVNAFLNFAKEGLQVPGFNFGIDRILHGEQLTELVRPLPPNAELVHRMKVKNIFDKGKNAVIVIETKTFDEDGDELVRNELTAVVRGAGGWGGDRGPSGEENTPPNRAPDAVVTQKIERNAALLYRLCGDWNPLHADPNFARAFGFDQPILHGLNTYGRAALGVVQTCADGDPRWLKSIKGRMSNSVFPGETLVTEIWKLSKTKIVMRAKVAERDVVVLSNAAIELFDALPAPKVKRERPVAKVEPVKVEPVKAEAAKTEPAKVAPAVSGDFVADTTDVFAAIADHVARNPGMTEKVKNVFQFRIKSPDSVWTIDLKNGAGSVAAGDAQKADCTLELTNSDFLEMTSGKADPQKLFMSGKLKISGNVMASQKLEFLKKMDPEQAKRAALAARAARG